MSVHYAGDCWPSQCQFCEIEDAVAEAIALEAPTTYGQCTACGAIEVALVEATGTRDLSRIGESAAYPIGFGCELCS